MHNEYRKRHDVEKLELDEELNELADLCADYYANEIKKTNHKCPHKETTRFPPIPKLGENLYTTWGYIESDPNDAIIEAIKWWYSEIEHWDFKHGNAKLGHSRLECTHFTQMIWKNTTKLGLGYFHIHPERKDVVVALYGPMGNIMGKFRQNVLPLKHPKNATKH